MPSYYLKHVNFKEREVTEDVYRKAEQAAGVVLSDTHVSDGFTGAVMSGYILYDKYELRAMERGV